ncbi:phytoene desaturase family protein [Caballeronia sp. HLA56]
MHSQGSYDLVVIGAGPNGLSLAVNMAKEGYRVVVVDRGSTVGGQAISEESLLPGFLIHPHANYLSYTDILRSQSFASRGAMLVPAIKPVAQHGLCFRDGRPPVIIYRTDHTARTFKSFACYSTSDARTFERCKRTADKLTETLSQLYFRVPDAARWSIYLAELASKFRFAVDKNEFDKLSARAIIDRLFESDEIRTLLYLTTIEFSIDLDEAGGAGGFLGYALWLLGRRRLPRAGMGTVSRALATAAEACGAEIILKRSVRKIVVEEGSVQGVLLDDDTLIAAPIVASAVPYDAMLGMLDEQWSKNAEDRSALANYERAEARLVGSFAACLRGVPRYKSGAFNRDIDECAQTFVGLDSTAEVIEREFELSAGRLPAPSGAIRVNSLWDSSQAPQGKHVAGADCAFPGRLGETYCAEIERAYPQAFATTWATYAPNIEELIEAQKLHLSRANSRKLVLREGDAQYRGPARGLYLCGSSTYPGGGVHGACGINAFQVILSDSKSDAAISTLRFAKPSR